MKPQIKMRHYPPASVVELAPCPFCGFDPGKSRRASLLEKREDVHVLMCWGCAAHGPQAENPDDAIAAWNRRSALAPPLDGEVAEPVTGNSPQAIQALEELAEAPFLTGNTIGPLYNAGWNGCAAHVRKTAADALERLSRPAPTAGVGELRTRLNTWKDGAFLAGEQKDLTPAGLDNLRQVITDAHALCAALSAPKER